MEHELLVYRCTLSEHRHFSIDCEEHEYSTWSPWFFDAIARAMMHRGGVTL
jgi:hypothetical protein